MGPILLRLTLPTTAAVLAMIGYGVIEAWLIGRLGPQALSAVSFTFPVTMVVISLGIGLGAGTSAVVARALGAGRRREAISRGVDASWLALLIGAACLLLLVPAGPWLLGVAGLVITCVGVAFVVRGVRRRFFEDVAPPRRFRRLVEALGAPGFVAKGVAVAVVGGLFVVAAFSHDPGEAGGLDGALQSLTTVPGGVVALVAIAVGLIVYGVYCVARGVWAR